MSAYSNWMQNYSGLGALSDPNKAKKANLNKTKLSQEDRHKLEDHQEHKQGDDIDDLLSEMECQHS